MTYPDDPTRRPPSDLPPSPPASDGGATAAVPPGGSSGDPYRPSAEGGYPPPGGGAYPAPGGAAYPPPGDQYSPAPPGAYPPPATTGGGSKNWMGITALVLGVVSLLLGFCAFAGFWAGIPAIVLGVLGMGAVRKHQATNRGLALAGVITGALGLLLTIGTLIFLVAFSQSDYAQCLEDAGDNQTAQQECAREAN